MLMTAQVGDVAPPFDAVDHAGRNWRLRDQAGRTVVLIFHRHLM